MLKLSQKVDESKPLAAGPGGAPCLPGAAAAPPGAARAAPKTHGLVDIEGGAGAGVRRPAGHRRLHSVAFDHSIIQSL